MDRFRLALFRNSLDSLAFFLDTRALTAARTLEEQLGAANPANFVHFERLDVGREQGEGPLYTYAVGDLTHGKSGRVPRTLTFDHITFETLDTLLVSFDDLIIDGDIVTGFELRKVSFSRQLFVYKSYSSLHNKNF